MSKPKPTELQWYAAARDDGWSFGDEDTPEDYCKTNLPPDELAVVHVYPTAHWEEEFNWWKAKP